MPWVVPITWSNGVVAKAQMDSLRDNLNFLKSSLDLITGNTTADTGDSTSLLIKRAATTTSTFETRVTGDTASRFLIRADGKLQWGPGGAAAQDTFLERLATNVLSLTGDTHLRNTWAAAASNTYLTGRATADTNNRISLGTDGSGLAQINFGPGTSGTTVALRYEASGALRLVNQGGGTRGALYVDPGGGSEGGMIELTGAGAETTWRLQSYGGFFRVWQGADVQFMVGPNWFGGVNGVSAAEGQWSVVTRYGSLPGTNLKNGQIVIGSDSKLYARVLGAWKSVTLT